MSEELRSTAAKELGPDEVIGALLDQGAKQAEENRAQAEEIRALKSQLQYQNMAHERSKGELGKRIRELQEEIKNKNAIIKVLREVPNFQA